MITFTSRGSFDKTESFLKKMMKQDLSSILNKYAQDGVAALSAATPVDSGDTSKSWTYEVEVGRGSATIVWKNTHLAGGKPIAIMLQYGHGTGTGGYVSGRDYINPAIRPVFDKIAADVWKEVSSA